MYGWLSKVTIVMQESPDKCYFASDNEEEEEEEEEEPLLIYTAQGSPFRCKKLSVINGSPERNNVLKLCIHMHYTTLIII